MNNLKRVLSTVLAGTMLAGMMVVGASAAGFPDADKIEHTEAVNTLVALNVINGKDDGNYDPEGSLTRAEMAKLAVFILHGGKDPVLGVKATPTYTDIKGNWAESYIEYCSSVGVINGVGDGKFDPNGTLTGSQAAKMLLVAMGYDAKVFGFTGADWEINTNVEANKAGLYEELEGMNPSATISRDDAAQLVYNAIQAKTMKLSWSQDMTDGTISQNYTLTGDSLFESKFSGKVTYGYIDAISYNEDKGEYTYSISNGSVFGYTGNDVVAAADLADDVVTAADYSDLFGMKVKVLSKKNSSTVYGMYAKGAVVVEGTVGALTNPAATDTTIKVDGTKYTLDGTAASVIVYNYNDAAHNGSIDVNKDAAVAYEKFVGIDNDGNGKIDICVGYPVYVGEVTFAGKSSITVAGKSFALDSDTGLYSCSAAIGNIAAGADFAIPSVKKGDYVAITVAAVENLPYEVTVLETMDGKVEGIKSGAVKIDGSWYDVVGIAPDLGKEYTFQVQDGYLVAMKGISSTTTDLVTIYKLGTTTDINGAKDAKVAFTDGSTATVKIKAATGTTLTVGVLYTYELDDGVYTLTAATTGTDGNTSYTKTSTSYFNATTDRLNDGTRIADDAVVFVLYKKDGTDYNSVKVMTGADLKKLSQDIGTFGTNVSFVDVESGFDTAKVVLLTAPALTSLPGADGDTKYGYIVSTPYVGQEDKDNYVYFSLWTGSATVPVKDKISGTTVPAGLANGAKISYKDLGDGLVDSAAALTLTEGAVVAYDGTYVRIAKAGGRDDLKITDDTVIIYINSSDKAGIEGGEISMADEKTENNYTPNVFFKATTDGKNVDILFVDVNNDTTGSVINYVG